ncbi:hypothetical protein EJ06DRAFT_12232 [Trichodelitschia bisporula]|uniref:Uncharacterized protein n=1 Tax=Trichodelitschia bisporula TaxID=703511 RepID=A0A6G1IAM6_9PEZI|nr:hypothetical protein EJ06DRAFT_12232 [Trichodelitschia bisporula]
MGRSSRYNSPPPKPKGKKSAKSSKIKKSVKFAEDYDDEVEAGPSRPPGQKTNVTAILRHLDVMEPIFEAEAAREAKRVAKQEKQLAEIIKADRLAEEMQRRAQFEAEQQAITDAVIAKQKRRQARVDADKAKMDNMRRKAEEEEAEIAAKEAAWLEIIARDRPAAEADSEPTCADACDNCGSTDCPGLTRSGFGYPCLQVPRTGKGKARYNADDVEHQIHSNVGPSRRAAASNDSSSDDPSWVRFSPADDEKFVAQQSKNHGKKSKAKGKEKVISSSKKSRQVIYWDSENDSIGFDDSVSQNSASSPTLVSPKNMTLQEWLALGHKLCNLDTEGFSPITSKKRSKTKKAAKFSDVVDGDFDDILYIVYRLGASENHSQQVVVGMYRDLNIANAHAISGYNADPKMHNFADVELTRYHEFPVLENHGYDYNTFPDDALLEAWSGDGSTYRLMQCHEGHQHGGDHGAEAMTAGNYTHIHVRSDGGWRVGSKKDGEAVVYWVEKTTIAA